MPLSIPESRLLGGLGRAYLLNVVRISIRCFAYGMFVILFWTLAVNFRRRGFSSLATRVMFCATSISFLLFTLDVGVQIGSTIMFFRVALIETVNVPLVRRPQITNDAVHTINLVAIWPQNFYMAISDLIVIWRAWVLFQDKKRVMILPCILWLGTFGTQFTYLVLILHTTAADYHALDATARYATLTKLAFGLSVGTNVVATMLIAYKLWSHRVFITKNLGLSSRRTSPAQKILVVLVESGVVYCGLQAAYLAIGLSPDVGQTANTIFSSIYSVFSAMYPTVVMVLVGNQRSITDVYDFDAD